jgi:hypothetical protein
MRKYLELKVSIKHLLILAFVGIMLFMSFKTTGLLKSTFEGMEDRKAAWKDAARKNDKKHLNVEGMENRGIPGKDIPEGDEDLYILKSEIVPPVCPRCPDIVRYRDKPCPPCPPCGRCPEPAFDCKKVPSYSKPSDSLPIPVLADFSNFGM